MTSLVAVVLDSHPLGLVTQKAGRSSEADACRAWMENLLVRGVHIYVPEIADYEVRRELVRVGRADSIKRLNDIKTLVRYLPITTDVMLTAADLWAKARNLGVTTADSHALDGDVIVAAQAISLDLDRREYVVATINVKHIARFVSANLWVDIAP